MQLAGRGTVVDVYGERTRRNHNNVRKTTPTLLYLTPETSVERCCSLHWPCTTLASPTPGLHRCIPFWLIRIDLKYSEALFGVNSITFLQRLARLELAAFINSFRGSNVLLHIIMPAVGCYFSDGVGAMLGILDYFFREPAVLRFY